MNPKILNKFGMFGGLVLIVLASSEFARSYNADAPKWNYLLMIFGMSIILLYTIFRKKRQG